MAKRANRKMIGGFVVIAVVILIGSLVVLGSGDLFKAKTRYVLYFDGSVKGLNIGSPVLFKGVQVGTVTNIVIRAYAKNFTSYIPVFIEVYPDKFQVINGNDIGGPKQRIAEMIEHGLRAQLATQSMITGQLLIEVGMYPGTPVDLKHLDKNYTEIPTIPSTMAKLGKALEKLNLQEIEVRFNSILDSTDRLLNNPEITASLKELKGVFQEAKGLMGSLNAKVDPLTDNLNGTITDARRLVNEVDDQMKPLSQKAKSALEDIGKLIRHVETGVDPVSKSMIGTLSTVNLAFKSINDLLSAESPTRADLDDTLRQLSGAAKSLRVLADYLEQHPDALIKGKGYKTY